MGLEAATVISELDPTFPTDIDPVNKGDDHMRLIKDVLQKQFPGVALGGYAIPIDATEAELNYSVGVTSSIQGQLTTNATAIADLASIPIGGIIMFNAVFAGIPVNFQLCDGSNGTPNMTDNFVYGTNTEGELLDSGGSADAVNVSHTHTFAGDALAPHDHNYDKVDPPVFSADGGPRSPFDSTSSAVTSSVSAGTPSGTNSTEGESGTDKNLPPFIKLAFIQRMS